jgi:lipoprotein-releasing system permease protein
LSFEFFISKRLILINAKGIKVSKPITRISIISISLAIVVNLLTIAIVTGFQNEVRKKITGFNAPIFISKAGTNSLYESDPIHKNQTEINELKTLEGVTNIYPVCYKPALLQSLKFEEMIKLASGKDSIIEKQEIAGIVMKGVGEDYDWTFLKKHLINGRLPNLKSKQECQEIIVSYVIAKNLNYKINDEVTTFYVKDQPITKRYKVVGIYNTGLEEFDKKLVYCDIREVQKISDFGISTEILIEDSLSDSGSLLLKAGISGNARDLLFDWGSGQDIYSGVYLNALRDTTIRLVVHQMSYSTNKSEPIDTAFLTVKCQSQIKAIELKRDDNNCILREELSTNSFNIFSGKDKIQITSSPGIGSSMNYVTGFEVHINDWDNLSSIQESLKSSIEMRPTKNGDLLQVQSILDSQSDLFAWLSFLDYNVLIIIFLMLIIGIINVGSAMLVLIVVRTNFIGILKALGSANWSIRKIFLYQAAYLILRGMFFGNIVGIFLCYIQMNFGIFKLDPTIYYLDRVPVELTFFNWLLINFITFTVCIVSLILPSYVVTRISPTKAIRFN